MESWLPGLLLFCTTAIPSAGLLIWLDLSAAAHFETHCRDRDPSRSHAGRNPMRILLRCCYMITGWMRPPDLSKTWKKKYDNREIAKSDQIFYASSIRSIRTFYTTHWIPSVALRMRRGLTAPLRWRRLLRRFFRYSISHSDDIVSLGKELNNIKRYFCHSGLPVFQALFSGGGYL